MPKDMSHATARQPVREDGYLPTTPVVAAAAEHRLPKIKGYGYRFLLLHNPDQWTLERRGEGWELLPVLKRFDIRPGVQGVRAQIGGLPPDAKLLLGRLEEEGTIRIQNPSSYMVAVEAHGGPRYMLRWERVKAYPDGAYEISLDRDGYDEWVRALVPSTIPPPRDSVIAALRRRLEKQIERASRQPHLPLAVKAVQEAEERLAGLDIALAAIRGEAGTGAADG